MIVNCSDAWCRDGYLGDYCVSYAEIIGWLDSCPSCRYAVDWEGGKAGNYLWVECEDVRYSARH